VVGHAGVLLFFVHTSLVLMSSLERQGTTRPGWVSAFYIRRAFRIYPLAMLTVLVVAAFGIPPRVLHPAIPPVAITPQTLALNLTLTQNMTRVKEPGVLGVLWSLPIEVQMYILLPLCFLIAKRSSRDVGLMVATLIALGVIVAHAPIPGLWRLSVFLFGPCFAGGITAYHIARHRVKPIIPAWTWPLLIGASSAVYFFLRPERGHPESAWLPCLLLGCCIPFVKNAPASVVTAAAHRVCEVSYGIYLLHVPVIWISFALLERAPTVLQWLAFLALITLLPVLAYRYVERPCVRLGQRLAHRRMPRELEPAAP
jgi:peptidoglycan/LPS O-acetylase OafA/YrhL